MNRRNIIISITAFVVFIAVLGIYLVIRQNKVVSPVTSPENISPTSVTLATWIDQAEFSFKYPQDVSLDPHDEDTENYAHIELSKSSYPGSVTVWVKDTQSATIEDWAAKSKITNALDSSLDTEPAKKVLADDEVKRITLSAIHNGYLYQIEVDSSDEYWKNIYDQVVASFVFTGNEENVGQTQGDTTNETAGDNDISYDEEEVLE